MIRRLLDLYGQTQQAVNNGDLNTAIIFFNEGYDLIHQLLPYVQNTPAAPLFYQYVEKFNALNFKIRNGYVTLNDFNEFLSPMSNIVSSTFGALANGVSNIIGGGINAVFDDVNGMVNGVNTAVGAFSRGDILGAITGGIESVIQGKINAIGIQ